MPAWLDIAWLRRFSAQDGASCGGFDFGFDARADACAEGCEVVACLHGEPGAAAGDDLLHALWRDAQLEGGRRSREVPRFEFALQDATGVDRQIIVVLLQ